MNDHADFGKTLHKVHKLGFASKIGSGAMGKLLDERVDSLVGQDPYRQWFSIAFG